MMNIFTNSVKLNSNGYKGFKGLLQKLPVVLFLLVSLLIGGKSWGQTVIAFDNFEPSGGTNSIGFTQSALSSGKGLANGTVSTLISSGNRPTSGTYIGYGASSGSNTYAYTTNVNSTLTSTTINTTGYTGVSISLEDFIASNNTGWSGSDNFDIQVSVNGGSNYTSWYKVTGYSSAYWAYDNNPTYITSSGTTYTCQAGNDATAPGYIKITPSNGAFDNISQLMIKIIITVGSTNRTFVLDNVTVQGNPATSSFTPGNLAVYRTGDGVSPLLNTGNVVYLDEYNTSGTLVQSVAMPTFANGNNKALYASGTATSEGQLTLSKDCRYIGLTGYASTYTSSLSGSTNGQVSRVAGVVSSVPAINTSVFFSNTSEFASGNNPRGAVTDDGTHLWLSGASSGLRYVSSTAGGGTASTSTQLNSTVTDNRNINIYYDYINSQYQLYTSTQTNSITIGSVGTGLPTTSSQTITNLSSLPTSATGINGYVYLVVAGTPVIYYVDATAGTIAKYTYSSGWTSKGTISLSNLYGITGKVSGTTVNLYITGSGSGGTSNYLYSFSDASANTSTLSGTPTTLINNTLTKQAFRGIAFVPLATAISIASPGNKTYNALGAQSITISSAANTTVNWIVSGSNIGGLNNGSGTGTISFTATGNGTATVTAYASYGDKISAPISFSITVSSGSITPTTPSGINLASTTYGTAGVALNQNISTSGISGTITVTPPVGIQVSSDNTNWYTNSSPLTTFSSSGGALSYRLDGTSSSAAAGNYDGATISLSGNSGTVTSSIVLSSSGGTYNQVNKKSLSVTAVAQSKTYGQTAPTSVSSSFNTYITVSGLQNSDAVNGVTLGYGTGSGSIAGNLATATAAPGGSTYLITPSALTLSPGSASNYTISYNTANLTVNQANITITANNQNKVYGTTQSTPVTGSSAFSISGGSMQNGETIGTVTLTYNNAAALTATSSAGTTSSITPSTATGGSGTQSNYNISYVNGTLSVTQAPLSITANSFAKTQGVTYIPLGTEFTYSPNPLPNSETIGSVTLTSSGFAAAAAAGTYSITPSAPTGGSFTLSNYNPTYNSGTLTINNIVQWYWNGSGSLDATGSWGTNPNGTGGTLSSFTGGNAVFNITSANSSVFSGSSWTVSGTNSKIVVGSGANLNVPNTVTLTATVDVSVNATLTMTNAPVSGLTLGTIDPASTVNYSGYSPLAFSTSNLATITYGNLTFTNTTVTDPGNSTTQATLTFAGNFTLSGTSVFNCPWTSLYPLSTSTASQTITGNNSATNFQVYDLQNGYTPTARSTGSLTLAANTPITITNTLRMYLSSSSTFNDGGNTLYVANNVELDGTGANYTLTGTINLNGTANGTQKICNNKTSNAAIVATLNNLTINCTGSSVASIYGTTNLSGNLTIASTCTGALSLNSSTMNIGGNIAYNSTTTSLLTTTSSTVVLNSTTAAQSISYTPSSGALTFATLTFNNTYNATPSINITGNVTATTLTYTAGNVSISCISAC